ncbi:putative translation repressor/antiviral protein Ski3 [Xylona heveae TC161]|uniref:Putative translation repressor/antiviral protein Ski3 n=1 Tax=Xylona heveae (strain CBS 132557 / TC161) TaxID=1328760 RepID=A0A165G7E0_XYLHT|nr:putative translation repressor/antiviral protein Ski3 [Xylona heveae TC161]KZF21824.1 putative translation repressor/antiviral protein Ski3 [Xylona heveae TC161]
MSGVKAALKAAKSALDAQNYEEAVTQARIVLDIDAQSYHGNVFLGLGLARQNQNEKAITAYETAARIKPTDPLAWQGLITVYEGQQGKKIDEYRECAVKLAEIYMEADDKERCQTVIDKFISFAKKYGSRLQIKRALQVLLPSSTIYDYLEGRIQHPSLTYVRLAEITEAEEKERINREIGERRTRLGARIGQVTADVKREVLTGSDLEETYQNIIDWANEDEVRREYEEKLFRRAYEVLLVLPADQKEQKRAQIEKLANGIVILKHPFALAWETVLEWKDSESLANWDVVVLADFIRIFPDHGLSKTLKAYLTSEISPFADFEINDEEEEKSAESNDTVDGYPKPAPLSSADRLLLMTEGVGESPASPLSNRLLGDYYLFLEEYESAVENSRNARKLYMAEGRKCGLAFQHNLDAVDIILGTALVQYQAPKNHPEAKSIFNDILKRKPHSADALIGIGLILEEEEEYSAAHGFLSKALARDPENVRVRAEAAWCSALGGNYSSALPELEACLPEIHDTDPRTKDLKAKTLYRTGICWWQQDPSKAARKDRKGAYARFLGAIQTNLNFAPAYTSLGVYYADYAKDRNRARRCFQKAFELSASEIEAAERLAREFADRSDWELVELIAQRVVDSGKVRPAPGSKKKGVSWPFAALGVAELNKQEYAKSIVSFQAALRISPNDYHSWVGLGESYHNSGRYIAATKAFEQAQALQAEVNKTGKTETWFAKYMLANVKRELGEYDEAIQDYLDVLRQRPREFGVAMAHLQTLIEGAWRNIELGFFGRAADGAKKAIDLAADIAEDRYDAFNLWKAVGDACAVWSWTQSRAPLFCLEKVKHLLRISIDTQEFELFADFDGIGKDSIKSLQAIDGEVTISTILYASILAHKRAIHACAGDLHAQAVAWYNLGWTEYRAYACLGPNAPYGSKEASNFLKAAVRCFKQAIELEASNADFWNALGVATTPISPKVAQHSLVRSLHLNDRNARVWTNIGTLYILQDDFQLANDAFSRAQSADPDYAPAWIGQGFLANLLGDPKEAQLLFTHAFEIADSSSLLAKRHFALSTFDRLLTIPLPSHNVTSFIEPLFALRQLQSQSPKESSYQHLAALYLERIGDHSAAIQSLQDTCSSAEAEYEVSESTKSLAQFAVAKTDLARVQLAVHDFASAAENAGMALDLSEEDIKDLTGTGRRKCRLSAHLTLGLAHYYMKSMDDAIDAFRAALEESEGAPDVVCLLAQVLWAKGGEEERSVARDQLFDCVEKHPGHVNATLLLGVIALLDNDPDVIAAVSSDLHSLRTADGLDTLQGQKIDMVLAAIAAVSAEENNKEFEQLSELMTSVMLSPAQPHGWAELAEVGQNSFPAEMALSTTAQGVPPTGSLGSDNLAKAFARTDRAGDAQRAIMTAPWLQDGWVALGDCVA